MKTTMKTKNLLIFLLLLALTAGCAPPIPATPEPGPPTLTPVKLGLGYIPSVQFAPIYVAIDQGYFTDEGIAVEPEHGFETDFLALLGTNERQFVVASGEQIVLGRAQGLPVTYVAAWYHAFPVVIFAPAESGIRQPQDLIGKKVGIPGLFGASYIAWKGLVMAAALPEAQIQLESIGFTQAAAVSEGLVDAATDYAVNGPVQLQLAGRAVNVIRIDDYLRLPANGLISNEKTIAEQPALVTGMTRALLRGIRFTLDNPDAAFAISLKFVPEAAQALDTNRAIFDASLPFWTPPPGRDLGFTDPAIWPETVAFMQAAGLIDQPVDSDRLWTNEFAAAAQP